MKTDFGISVPFSVRGMRHSECIGSYAFMAPEVAKMNYDERADTWSIGVVLYMMLCGEMPFGGASDVEILECVKRGEYEMGQPVWNNISHSCKDLVRSLMEPDADKRITVEAALQHKWIAGEGLGRAVDIGKRVVESLRAWVETRAFDKAVIGVVAGILEDDAELDEIRAAFATVDADGSGQLSATEFKAAISQLDLNLSDGDVDVLFESVDMDHSGTIDVHEFMGAALSKQQYLRRDRLQAAFAKIDLDHSGAIDASELQQLLPADQDAADVLREIGKGPSDEITFAEFQKIMDPDNEYGRGLR